MRTNKRAAVTPRYTHEGGRAYDHLTPEQELRRSLLACLLWEDTFYESGVSISTRIRELTKKVPVSFAAELAKEARTQHNLRHAPLWLAVAMSTIHKGHLVGDTIADVIQRADEIPEFLAMYAKANGRKPDQIKPVSHQVQKGLAKAFLKFDEYQLAKYDRNTAVKLRDALFLSHAKPANDEQQQIWQRLIDGKLTTPDTWETRSSRAGPQDEKGKREMWEDMLQRENLGYMALLRNLRNMHQAGVDRSLVQSALRAGKGRRRVLPFRYVAAARAVPSWEGMIDEALCTAILAAPTMHGRTVVVVDVSISMRDRLSSRSDLTRMDAAAALASLINGEDVRVFSFSSGNATWQNWRRLEQDPTFRVLVECPRRYGMGGIDAIINSQEHGGTFLVKAIKEANEIGYDRIIVITDEQTHGDPTEQFPDPVGQFNYMINVATNKNGVGYGKWTHIDGFSEAVIRYIHESEMLMG